MSFLWLKLLERLSLFFQTGNSTCNLAPCGFVLVAQIRPPCFSIISREIVKPIPVPPALVEVRVDCTNLSKIRSSSDSGTPGP